jgi:meiotic recombination protein SPO11
VTEKDSVFNRLAADRIHYNIPCILVTGRGMPDVATRFFVHYLHTHLDIPVLGLFDYNPHGVAIMMNYMQGSAKMV